MGELLQGAEGRWLVWVEVALVCGCLWMCLGMWEGVSVRGCGCLWVSVGVFGDVGRYGWGWMCLWVCLGMWGGVGVCGCVCVSVCGCGFGSK